MIYGSYRNTWAEISLDAIFHNVSSFKKYVGKQTKLMAVVKADGYGHGSVEIAKTAMEAGADYLAVALLDEALILRKSGIHSPLLVLGFTGEDGVEAAVENDITLTIFTKDVLKKVEQEAEKKEKTARIHLKIETGMNRIGLANIKEVMEIAGAINSRFVQLEGAFTHFADADNTDPAYTEKQFQRFQAMMNSLSENNISIPLKHCCNSAGAIQYPEMHLDMVRVGIGLYGLYPSEHLREKISLKQAMYLKTKPVMIKTVDQGEPISYGCTYRPEEKSVIATIPLGYADGFSRLLSNRGEVTARDKRVPIVGRICMDQSMVDVTSVKDINITDTITIFGEPSEGYIYMGEFADWIGTIHYEIACLIGKRIPRIYIKDGKVVKKKSLLTNGSKEN